MMLLKPRSLLAHRLEQWGYCPSRRGVDDKERDLSVSKRCISYLQNQSRILQQHLKGNQEKDKDDAAEDIAVDETENDDAAEAS